MRLFDMDSEKTVTLSELKAEYIEFKNEDSFNHAESFTIELFEILMATVNNRNNCEILGMTGKETSNFILALRKKIMKG